MYSNSNKKTLILGVGNILLSDEGFGVRVVERLSKDFVLPDEIQLLDGGTLGMDLLYYLEGVNNLMIIDAVNMNEQPGHIIRLTGDKVPSFLSVKMSPHQIGVPDMLSAANLMGIYPEKVVLWGIQPQKLEVEIGLSAVVEKKIDPIIEKILDDLTTWGHTVQSAR